MLPGFRFLLATVVLAVSVLVFGLGAAALLRAAHEEFANLPSWRLAQQPLLAPQPTLTTPTLAMLRIEAPKPTVEAAGLQAPPPELLRLNALREIPETKAAETAPPAETALPVAAATPNAVATPSNDAAAAPAEPPFPAIAPAAEAAAGLKVQAGIDAPAAATNPVEDVRPEAGPAAASASRVTLPDPRPVQPSQLDPNPVEATSAETEAFESTPLETVSTVVRSSEATATDPLPQTVAKKAVRPTARTVARRRLAIARARAARERTILQQPGHNPDPLTQIFGGSGGGNVPRPNSG